jgi:two-component system, OmpR family, sensor histidine kinase VicK
MIISNPSTTPVEEKTEVIYGDENIINDTLKVYSVLRKYLDICNDSKGPSMFVIPNHPVTIAFRELKERGIRLRFIAEITKDNIVDCKELMKTCELRHLDEVKGNFGISDGIYYRASAKTKLSSPPPLLICSTLRAFVEQQQYFFDMLWKKSIPVTQRIKEIEEDLKREFIETIRDSEETLTLTSKVLSSAIEEILIVFSHINTLRLYEKYGILDLLRKKADSDVAVRILIGLDSPIEEKTVESENGYRNIELRYLLKSIQTKLTTIITDRELSLVIEERENEDAIGFATYSNSESTVLSYASIFENLWAQSID